MSMLHPASLLLAWFGFAVTLQRLPAIWLASVLFASLVATGVFAARRGFSLLRRARWLLLSLALLYLFATPGEYLPGFWGDIGLTHEGIQMGGVQLARLLALLSSLALVHEIAGTRGLVAGLYWWLKPLAWRESTVVRLMLVLEMVEQRGKANWREWLMPVKPEGNEDGPRVPSTYHLSMPALKTSDKLLMTGTLVAAVAWVMSS